ncbi:hypothetical protein PVAND_003984 [Polypedilum vanderplanki]|uniref:Uncharacterized protein n=1 Tax=Polypedilum vanderplanki TaxID=319348 RepID=A0A9J6BVS7_POLVA|nr:hypothetical protein PVAND_003984 [Polypedilum vanderplanki]
MPRSRSRSKDRSRRSRSRDKDRKRRDRERRRSRSKSYDRLEKDKIRRRSRSRSYEKRNRDRRRRDRSRSYDRKDHRYRSKSHDRSKDRYRDRYSSDNSEKRFLQSSSTAASNSVKPIVIIANTHSKGNKHKTSIDQSHLKRDHRESFEISNEFSQEGFEQFSKDHGIDFSKIETDEDREAVHEKMQELLKAHFAAQGKIYPPPPKEERQLPINATGFVNDGSFLEQFKKMQEEQKKQAELEQKRKAESLLNLPIRRRRAGLILKTGVVAKTKLTNQERSSDMPSNAWGMYIKEVQKYKGSSCDSDDSKNRPLVK